MTRRPILFTPENIKHVLWELNGDAAMCGYVSPNGMYGDDDRLPVTCAVCFDKYSSAMVEKVNTQYNELQAKDQIITALRSRLDSLLPGSSCPSPVGPDLARREHVDVGKSRVRIMGRANGKFTNNNN